MIPGEIITKPGEIEINAGAAAFTLEVANSGDRPDPGRLALSLLRNQSRP